MFQSRLDSIAEFIMQHNTYFAVGYSNVWLDETTGFVADDKTPVFPSDNGNYFYLRLPKSIDFLYSTNYNYSDCSGGIGSRSQVILVAVIKEKNPDVLLENLVATLRNYKQAELRLRSALYQAMYVIEQELAFISESEREQAMKRIDYGSSYVSITFDITETILSDKLSCIEPPCSC